MQNTTNYPERVFNWHNHLALWFSLGVGLLVMQVGAYLVPSLGTKQALLAVIFGSIIGAALLAWVAFISCHKGFTSANLMIDVYGKKFAKLPIFLNIIQLIGWATFEIVVMRDGTKAILDQAFIADTSIILPTLFWGLVVLVLLRASMLTLVRKIVSQIGLPLVILSLIWLTIQFALQLDTKELSNLWQKTGDGGMNTFQALDLVIAMPISWLPLVSDYARHGKTAKGAFVGTWLGFTLANIWCYALGVLIITVIGTNIEMVGALLLAQGGLIALSLILIDELDNTYGDLYSSSVCANNLAPKLSIKTWGTILACISIALALVLPMHALEPFLLSLSSVFVPLFGTILGFRGFTFKLHMASKQKNVYNLVAITIWLLGIALYHSLDSFAPQFGSSIPTLLFTFILGLSFSRKSSL